jgi:hypothetical protein
MAMMITTMNVPGEAIAERCPEIAANSCAGLANAARPAAILWATQPSFGAAGNYGQCPAVRRWLQFCINPL